MVERGFVTYSNSAKTELLGVDPELIAATAPSARRSRAPWPTGALARTPAHIAVSVTGIAGPDGGSAEKPVGLVYFGVAARGEATRVRECRFGDIGRAAIRLASVREALEARAQASSKQGLSHA